MDNKDKMPTKKIAEFNNNYNPFYTLYAITIKIDNDLNVEKQLFLQKNPD